MNNRKSSDGDEKKVSRSFATGAIALVFLAIGYQTALLVHRAATARVLSLRDRPDTVYIIKDTPGHAGDTPEDAPREMPLQAGAQAGKRTFSHSPEVSKVRESATRRSWESFPFDPNTVSLEDLVRLGFTPAQASSIDNFRKKGGRFHRAADFARSYVVADSVFRRLEPYIRIPKTDLNSADSAGFDDLPGIGPYYAAQMVRLRERLHGYSYPEQLLDIYRFDEERLGKIADLVTVGPSEPYPLWSLPADSLALHPYIGRHEAAGIVLFRENNPPSKWSVEALAAAGVISGEMASKLSRCRIASP